MRPVRVIPAHELGGEPASGLPAAFPSWPGIAERAHSSSVIVIAATVGSAWVRTARAKAASAVTTALAPVAMAKAT